MILPFKTKFDNGEPTYFPEMIILSIFQEILKGNKPELSEKLIEFYDNGGASMLKEDFWHKEYYENLTQGKPHTIRADEKNRWKPGNKIHFYINNRTKNALQFAPVLTCTGVQKIKIYHYDVDYLLPDVVVDGKVLDLEEKWKLAQNDGFKDLDSFFNWFNTDFTGKIIHWTDLRY